MPPTPPAPFAPRQAVGAWSVFRHGRLRIGVSVADGVVRAAAVRAGVRRLPVLLGVRTAPYATDAAIADALGTVLRELLRTVHVADGGDGSEAAATRARGADCGATKARQSAVVPRWRRVPVVVAFGAPHAQIKELTDLPPLRRARDVERLVVGNAGHFFRKNGVPLVSLGVRLVRPGTAWAAFVDASALAAAARGCRAADLRLQAALPAAVAVGHAVAGAAVWWRESEAARAATVLTFDVERTLTAMRRAVHGVDTSADVAGAADAAPASAGTDQDESDGLEAAGLDAAAWGAACLVPPSRIRQFAFAPAGSRGSGAGLIRPARALPAVFDASATREAAAAHPRLAWVRTASAVGACMVAATWAAVAPVFAARRARQEAERQLAVLDPLRVRAAQADIDALARVSAPLAALDAFAQGRGSPARVLADLARELPRRAALVSFVVDTAGGTVVATAPRVAGVIAALERVPGITAVTIVGPILSETPAQATVLGAAVGPPLGALPGSVGTLSPPGTTPSGVPSPPTSRAGMSRARHGAASAMGGRGEPARADTVDGIDPVESDVIERATLRFRLMTSPTSRPPAPPLPSP